MKQAAIRWSSAHHWILLGVLLFFGLTIAPSLAQSLAKFEPESGCYIGAFIEKDKVAPGDYRKFEQLTRRKHATYFTYVGYGMPFPSEWVTKVKEAGAAPHIAFEPNNGLSKVGDDDYLRNWARAARQANCPIFLRFASEMNGSWTAYHDDPDQYIEKFRLVHDVMEREAPNVALVWTPFATFNENIAIYYPGDEYVDWVGVNIYSVYVHDGNPKKVAYQEDPIDFLRFIYNRYATRKPIQISEFAAAHYHKSIGKPVVEFAVEKMQRFYDSVRRDFPRVKSINWFCMDTVDESLADSNYCILDNEQVLSTYRNLVADSYFLSDVIYRPASITGKLPSSGISAQERDDDIERALSNRGAVMASLGGVVLRGIENGVTYEDHAQLVVVIPPTVRARYVVFDVDNGKVTRITNRAPYALTVFQEKIGSGSHTIQVTVRDSDGLEHQSKVIQFHLTEKPSS